MFLKPPKFLKSVFLKPRCECTLKVNFWRWHKCIVIYLCIFALSLQFFSSVAQVVHAGKPARLQADVLCRSVLCCTALQHDMH
jgi:hypothetical protein